MPDKNTITLHSTITTILQYSTILITITLQITTQPSRMKKLLLI